MNPITRRDLIAASAGAPMLMGAARKRPNVILIITDDQGYGDLSLHGNPHLQTPNMDRIGRQGVQFTQFQVCPVCSPTRASIMTGRYNYRTGVVDTFLGRSMMHPDETTIPELLGKAGYRTGIFGKWHLGDNYPLRAIDQGFQEAVTHNGGGIGQPSDPPGNSYFDPVLRHNGKQRNYQGYCTDIFFREAIQWIESNRRVPFFAYIAPNAPHEPLTIADSYVQPFLAKGLDEKTARVYGMVVNLDENIGRLLAKLRALELERDTIVIFMTDNGPQRERYNAGMRGRKGTPYQGGIRVPFFLRWPAEWKAGTQIDRIAAHIDILPTLMEACGVPLPPDLKLDGRSLMPLLRGGAADWPDRTLFTQWHRGNVPELFRSCAARSQRYKLINGEELYDLQSDPAESNNIAAQRPDVAARLRRQTEQWFRDVSATRGYAPPRIHLGTPHENPVTLTRQDWRVTEAVPDSKGIGHWEVKVTRTAAYEVTLKFAPPPAGAHAVLRVGDLERKQPVAAGAASIRFDSLQLDARDARLEAWIESAGRRTGVLYVDVRSL